MRTDSLVGTTIVGASVVCPMTLTPLSYWNSQPHWKAET